MKLYPHAKINLSLYITGRRPDGYHELDTVFLPVSLCDELKLEKAESFSFSCPGLPLPAGDNLAVKAWRLMQEHFGIGPVRMELSKRIPSEAGLGGGSADAAAVLLGCQKLFGLKAEQEDLVQLGRQLGADVPAQLFDGPTRGLGTGTELSEIEGAAPFFFLIVKPPAGFSTPAMYRRWDVRREGGLSARKAAARQRILLQALKSGEAAALAACLENDFESVLTEEENTLLKTAREFLSQAGALGSLLSGSGSAVFGLFADKKAQQAGAAWLREKLPDAWRLFPCESFGRLENEK